MKKGDTIIEVAIALSVFSMVVLGAISIINQGINTSQYSVESTMVQNEIQAQAEALRFIHDAHVSEINMTEDSEKPYSNLWKEIVNTGDPFVLNPRALDSTSVSNASKTGNYANIIITNFDPVETYPQITYNNKAPCNNVNPNVLSDTCSSNTISSVQGISIIINKSPTGRTCTDEENNQVDYPDYYDFHINSSWDSPSASVASSLYTDVHLYDPDQPASVRQWEEVALAETKWELFDNLAISKTGYGTKTNTKCTPANAIPLDGIADVRHENSQDCRDASNRAYAEGFYKSSKLETPVLPNEHLVVGENNITFIGYIYSKAHQGTKTEIDIDDDFVIEAEINPEKIVSHPNSFVGIRIGPLAAIIYRDRIFSGYRPNSKGNMAKVITESKNLNILYAFAPIGQEIQLQDLSNSEINSQTSECKNKIQKYFGINIGDNIDGKDCTYEAITEKIPDEQDRNLSTIRADLSGTKKNGITPNPNAKILDDAIIKLGTTARLTLRKNYRTYTLTMKYTNAEGKSTTTTATVKTTEPDSNGKINFIDGNDNILQTAQDDPQKVDVSLYMQHADHGCTSVFKAIFNYITMHTTKSQHSGADICQDYSN